MSKEETGNWYKDAIEEPVRDLVKLLRNNGFNTECSCGHEMYVQCEYLVDGEIQRLHNLLFNNGYRNYTIEVRVQVYEGHQYPSIDIKLPKKCPKIKIMCGKCGSHFEIEDDPNIQEFDCPYCGKALEYHPATKTIKFGSRKGRKR